jgi:hypothetical protein
LTSRRTFGQRNVSRLLPDAPDQVRSIRSLTSLDCARLTSLSRWPTTARRRSSPATEYAGPLTTASSQVSTNRRIMWLSGNPGILGRHPAPHVAPVPRGELVGSLGRVLCPLRQPVPVVVHGILDLGEALSLVALGDEQVVKKRRAVHSQRK